MDNFYQWASEMSIMEFATEAAPQLAHRLWVWLFGERMGFCINIALCLISLTLKLNRSPLTNTQLLCFLMKEPIIIILHQNLSVEWAHVCMCSAQPTNFLVLSDFWYVISVYIFIMFVRPREYMTTPCSDKMVMGKTENHVQIAFTTMINYILISIQKNTLYPTILIDTSLQSACIYSFM